MARKTVSPTKPNKTHPPKWIEPQLTRLVDEAPDGPNWLHEIKYDGYRMHARLLRNPLKALPFPEPHTGAAAILTRYRHHKSYAKADCNAHQQLAGKIKGDGADRAPQVLAGLSEGGSDVIECPFHAEQHTLKPGGCESPRDGVIAPAISES
ncbi:hypothetical protein NKI20_21800 [Mesorhizobium sp. M0830]|uniref:hypothetical protein n=1 Tax=Mesorhizobium sp. M0830 TaxID=2957008 RepID=UPI00333CBAB4